ncbi:MAG: hypothetical protein NXH88_05120 [Hyphomonas sp.]|nr:hypothetical protein [Hyphomonas sp.]
MSDETPPVARRCRHSQMKQGVTAPGHPHTHRAFPHVIPHDQRVTGARLPWLGVIFRRFGSRSFARRDTLNLISKTRDHISPPVFPASKERIMDANRCRAPPASILVWQQCCHARPFGQLTGADPPVSQGRLLP